jgi:hypothetical protein
MQNLGLCSVLKAFEQGDLYRGTPDVTRGLGFSGHIRRIAPFNRPLQHTRGCGESVLTQILTGPANPLSIGLNLQYAIDNGDSYRVADKLSICTCSCKHSNKNETPFILNLTTWRSR